MTFWFEDAVLEEITELGSYTFTADNIKAFARKFDPQPFHLDEEAARTGLFGQLAASGWHTVSVWMKLIVAQRQAAYGELAAAGGRQPRLGPSPGYRDLKWPNPVFVGDEIFYSSSVIAKIDLKSRPDWGLFEMRNTGRKGDGTIVLEFIGKALVDRRHPADA